MVMSRNALFIGPAGGGKSVRCGALLCQDNYPIFLANTRLANVNVEIHSIEVNLIPVVTPAEISYEHTQDENGHWHKNLAGLDLFIYKHGFHNREDFEKSEAERLHVLNTGQGTLRIYVVWVDDFDRVQDSHMLNSFIRQIEDHHHVLVNQEVRWLNLQCVASSNSSIGRASRGYLGSQGLDMAVANRFLIFFVHMKDCKEILKAEYQGSNDFIDKLCNIATDITKKMAQGSYSSLGELGLRRLRPCVEAHIWTGMPEEESANLLFTGLSDEHELAESRILMSKYFNLRKTGKSDLNFGATW